MKRARRSSAVPYKTSNESQFFKNFRKPVKEVRASRRYSSRLIVEDGSATLSCVIADTARIRGIRIEVHRLPSTAARVIDTMTRAILGFLLSVSSMTAYADIYACPGRHGMTTYQNFPCEFDSLGSVPATVPVASAQAAFSRPGDRARAMPVATMPRVGMTTEQVKAIWGEPIDTAKEEYAKGDIETWTYADSRSIRFDLKGRVADIKW